MGVTGSRQDRSARRHAATSSSPNGLKSSRSVIGLPRGGPGQLTRGQVQTSKASPPCRDADGSCCHEQQDPHCPVSQVAPHNQVFRAELRTSCGHEHQETPVLTLALILGAIVLIGTTSDAGSAEAAIGRPTSNEQRVTQDALRTTKLPPAALVGTAAIYAETDKQVEMAAWAIEQFAAAGLELPPVTIHMHTSRAHCSVYPKYIRNGYYIEVQGEHVIHSCDNAWTLLHELGHVWDAVALDDNVREQILDLQGLNSWRHETWNQAGAEHLASIIAWGIEGTYPERIGNYTRGALADVYATATGNQPPTLIEATPNAS